MGLAKVDASGTLRMVMSLPPLVRKWQQNKWFAKRSFALPIWVRHEASTLPPLKPVGPVPPLGGGRSQSDSSPPRRGEGDRTTKTYHFTSTTRHQVFRQYAPVGFLYAAEFGALRDMGCIRLKKENSWCTSRGCSLMQPPSPTAPNSAPFSPCWYTKNFLF